MRDLRSMMIDHIMEYGEFPDEDKILNAAFGQLGELPGHLQAPSGRMAKYVVKAAKPMRPVVRGMDIMKIAGVKW